MNGCHGRGRSINLLLAVVAAAIVTVLRVSRRAALQMSATGVALRRDLRLDVHLGADMLEKHVANCASDQEACASKVVYA